MNIIKKYLITIGLIVVAVMIVVFIHDSISIWYSKRYDSSKAGLSWGLLVTYYVYYVFPMVLFISSVLIFNRKIHKYISILLFISLLAILMVFNISDHPFRTVLLAGCMTIVYMMFLWGLRFFGSSGFFEKGDEAM
ncbi:MAG: hypothetical protein OIF50_01695 [Flavobacteriaceae bacterium]|nr:hypothetical protein [Flavobacteriaceae bacterium]